MFFHKNGKNGTGQTEEGEGLYPVLFVMNSLKDYHTALVNKEVDSLKELGMISSSFDSPLPIRQISLPLMLPSKRQEPAQREEALLSWQVRLKNWRWKSRIWQVK